MKRTILFLTLLLSSLGAFAYDFIAHASGGQALYFNIIGNNVEVTYPGTFDFPYDYYTGPSGSLIIPSSVTHNGITYSVTSIGDRAFKSRRDLTSVNIPESVTRIGNQAFYYCSGLTSINIPNSVTSIGEYAFSGCSGFSSVIIPNSVTEISNGIFQVCSGLTNISIPDSVTSIGDYAFENCYNLTNVTIPDLVTRIGDYAFKYCYRLTNVTIPDMVTYIGNYAFDGCHRLASLYIGNSVTSIGDWAFNSCDSLTIVTIPNSVVSIGEYAFAIPRIDSVTIPNSITDIGASAFYCSNISNINYLGTVADWCNINFGNAISNPILCAHSLSINGTSVTQIEIPVGVDIIKDYAFCSFSTLTSVTIPNTVTRIGKAAFRNCNGLTSIIIPYSVNNIGDYAFDNCPNLATIYDQSNLPITRGSSNNGGVAQYATRVVKVLTDDRGDFNAPNDYTVDEVTYTRNYEQGNRSTICLPFKPATVNGSSTTNLKFYEFADFDGTTITFNEVDFEDLAANTPYMVEWPALKTAQDFVFGATDATIPATGDAASRTVEHGNGKFIGTMERTHMNSTNYYGYKNGYFVQSAGGQAENAHAHVNPFRAYFEITPSGSQGFAMPTELSVRFNTAEDNVGIDSVEPQQSNIRYSNDVYDMMGRIVRKNAESLDGLRKGVYIWKGEKKIVF